MDAEAFRLVEEAEALLTRADALAREARTLDRLDALEAAFLAVRHAASAIYAIKDAKATKCDLAEPIQRAQAENRAAASAIERALALLGRAGSSEAMHRVPVKTSATPGVLKAEADPSHE